MSTNHDQATNLLNLEESMHTDTKEECPFIGDKNEDDGQSLTASKDTSFVRYL